MIVIGDVHGKWKKYSQLLSTLPEGEPTLQLGDMGIGFPSQQVLSLRPYDYFFRGNHDSPLHSKAHTNYLGEGGVASLDNTSFFYVPGAWSIDWKMRLEGVSWWRDEELSVQQLDALVEEYERTKPNLVITHDCPAEASQAMLQSTQIDVLGWGTDSIPTRTGQALSAMFRIHKPKHWIFGHWHRDWKQEIQGTLFQCLNELSWVKI